MGSFSIWHWLIVLVIVMLVFGTKKLGNIGGDLGKTIKDFQDGVKGEPGQSGAKGNGQQNPDQAIIHIDVKEKTQN